MASEQQMVVVKDLYKSFKLPHEQHNGVKQLIVNFAKRKKGYEVQHVLDDISFQIKKGEFFGIVGKNGSGKSTLLKLLAGIYEPDKGQVHIGGSLTPFIELGVGFNPELTGKENVFLNGALLGFGRKEMEAMYDDIVTFAELDRFMDQKLKNYSSGMQVRLAFSIAIRAQSDILLIDEVLAVGDAAFQQKCFNYFDKLKEEGRTIILVTHDMNAVRQFCDRAMLIHKGEVMQVGSTEQVSAAYERLNFENSDSLKKESKTGNEVKTRFLDSKGKLTSSFSYGDQISLKVDWTNTNQAVYDIGIVLLRGSEVVFATNTKEQSLNITDKKTVIYNLRPKLGNGRYKFNVVLFGKTEHSIVHNITTESITIYEQPSHEEGRQWAGLIYIDNSWSK